MPFYEVGLSRMIRTTQRVEADTPALAFLKAQRGHPGYLATTATEILRGNGEPKPDDQLGESYPNLNSDQSAAA